MSRGSVAQLPGLDPFTTHILSKPFLSKAQRNPAENAGHVHASLSDLPYFSKDWIPWEEDWTTRT